MNVTTQNPKSNSSAVWEEEEGETRNGRGGNEMEERDSLFEQSTPQRIGRLRFSPNRPAAHCVGNDEKHDIRDDSI